MSTRGDVIPPPSRDYAKPPSKAQRKKEEKDLKKYLKKSASTPHPSTHTNNVSTKDDALPEQIQRMIISSDYDKPSPRLHRAQSLNQSRAPIPASDPMAGYPSFQPNATQSTPSRLSPRPSKRPTATMQPLPTAPPVPNQYPQVLSSSQQQFPVQQQPPTAPHQPEQMYDVLQASSSGQLHSKDFQQYGVQKHQYEYDNTQQSAEQVQYTTPIVGQNGQVWTQDSHYATTKPPPTNIKYSTPATNTNTTTPTPTATSALSPPPSYQTSQAMYQATIPAATTSTNQTLNSIKSNVPPPIQQRTSISSTSGGGLYMPLAPPPMPSESQYSQPLQQQQQSSIYKQPKVIIPQPSVAVEPQPQTYTDPRSIKPSPTPRSETMRVYLQPGRKSEEVTRGSDSRVRVYSSPIGTTATPASTMQQHPNITSNAVHVQQNPKIRVYGKPQVQINQQKIYANGKHTTVMSVDETPRIRTYSAPATASTNPNKANYRHPPTRQKAVSDTESVASLPTRRTITSEHSWRTNDDWQVRSNESFGPSSRYIGGAHYNFG